MSVRGVVLLSVAGERARTVVNSQCGVAAGACNYAGIKVNQVGVG